LMFGFRRVAGDRRFSTFDAIHATHRLAVPPRATQLGDS
jgi:hypothetical protein